MYCVVIYWECPKTGNSGELDSFEVETEDDAFDFIDSIRVLEPNKIYVGILKEIGKDSDEDSLACERN